MNQHKGIRELSRRIREEAISERLQRMIDVRRDRIARRGLELAAKTMQAMSEFGDGKERAGNHTVLQRVASRRVQEEG